MKVDYKEVYWKLSYFPKSSDPGSLHPHTNSVDTKVETDATIKSEQHTIEVA